MFKAILQFLDKLFDTEIIITTTTITIHSQTNKSPFSNKSFRTETNNFSPK